MADIQERRRLPRKYLVIYSRVFERNTGKILGYLSDLNRGGAMIISDDPITVDTRHPLRFDLPDPTQFDMDHLNVDGRVAWCSPDIDPAFWNIGLEFIETTPKMIEIIDAMIEMYEFRREHPHYPTPPSMLDEEGS